MRIACSFFVLVILAGSVSCPGCGGGGIEPGVPESARDMPPPEIPGTREMEEKLQKQGKGVRP